MSQENVELVRRAIDAYNRGQDALDLFDPEIEWVTTGRFVEPDTYRGHERYGDTSKLSGTTSRSFTWSRTSWSTRATTSSLPSDAPVAAG